MIPKKRNRKNIFIFIFSFLESVKEFPYHFQHNIINNHLDYKSSWSGIIIANNRKCKIMQNKPKTHLTSARRAVLELLEQSEAHLSPAEVHQQLKSRLPSLNLSTVYRSLEYLVAHELITVANLGTGSPVYERLGETPHHHLVCLNCKHIQEIEHELVDPFFDTLKQQKDFAIQTNHLVLYGLCSDCQETHPRKD